MDTLIYSLLFLPLLIPIFALLREANARMLWWLSAIVAGADFFGFILLFSRYYSKPEFRSSGISTHPIAWSSAWDINFQFRLDFLSSTLLLALSLVFFLAILNARSSLEASKAKLAALNLFQVFMLGLVSAQDFALCVIFLSGLLVPELLLMGWDEAGDRSATLKKHAINAAVSNGIFVICVLFFSEPFRAAVSHWFALSAGEYEVLNRQLIFLLFCLAVTIRMPIFPFQSRLGCSFRLSSIEHLLPMLCCANIGFYILFRYGPNYFQQELIASARILAWLATGHILYSILYIIKNSGHREYIYGTQLVWNGLLLLGFVGFGPAAWVGSWSLFIIEILVLALALFVSVAVERRALTLSTNALRTAPGYSVAAAFSTAALLGAPISLAFYSVVLILWSGMEVHRFATLPILLCLPLLLWIGVRRLFFRFSGVNTVNDHSAKVKEFDRTEAAVIFSLALVVLLCGICPDFLMKPIGEQIDYCLNRSVQDGGQR